MTTTIQYITNEQGDRVGVMLDLAAYERLTHPLAHDPDCLLNVSAPELEAFANIELALNSQQTLNALLTKNAQEPLSESEHNTLDRLLAQVDQLTLLKARAKYTLRCLRELETS